MARHFFPALVACVVLTGCGVFGDHVADDPAPTHSSAPDTVTAHQVGDELTITAVLTEVIAEDAIVVQDADLPPHGVLVLGTGPDDLHPTDLVTVRGRLAIFRFVAFAPGYGLLKPGPYQRFEGKKIVLAESVKSWT